MAASLTSSQIIDVIRNRYLNTLTAIPGREAVVGLAVVGLAAANRSMKFPWKQDQFIKLATGTTPVGTGLVPPGPVFPNEWTDYLTTDYDRVRNVAAGNDQARNRVYDASISGDLRLPIGGASRNLRLLMSDAINDSFILSKSNKLIYNVPKSEELLQRFLTPLFKKSLGIDIMYAGNISSALLPHMQGPLFKQMPKSDYEMYKAMLNLTPQDIESLKKYDERIDQIHEALSQGPSTASTGIPPRNIIPVPKSNSISAISNYPENLQRILSEKRKSDPSNNATNNAINTLNKIRVSMNGGLNKNTNFVGGSNNKARPLYPNVVMNGGSHPFAMLEGGAWNPARESPNPVAALDSRIKSLEAQFKSTTGKDLGPLSRDLRNYADNINTTLGKVQNSLQVISTANQALAQYPPGLGIDASQFDEAKLKEISAHAAEINKNAARASKQMNTLDKIGDILQDMVNKSNPASRS